MPFLGHENVAELLIQNGANVSAVGDQGDTALIRAAFVGKNWIFIRIISHCTSISFTSFCISFASIHDKTLFLRLDELFLRYESQSSFN